MTGQIIRGIQNRTYIRYGIRIALVIAMLCVAFVISSDPADAKTDVNVKVGNKTFNGVIYDNPTSKVLTRKLPIKYRMSDLNGNEKYRYLNYSLPTNEKPVKKIKAGDIMLYGDDCLVVFYKSFKTSYEYTRIGRITNVKGLKKAVGKGKVTISISKKKKIALNKKSLTLQTGQSAKLKLTGAPKTKVKWKTSNKRIVTVYKGRIKAKRAGTAKVTATYKKKKYVCRITVKQKPKAVKAAKATDPIETSKSEIKPVNNGGAGQSGETGADPSAETQPHSVEPEGKTLALYIDDRKVDVSWENNEAVSKLKELARVSPIEIKMNRYGGFEQVGSIGTSIPRADVQMKTKPGDIVLYSGNQMVVFYGSNSWSYTKLGHIENMDTAELTELLSETDRTIRVTL